MARKPKNDMRRLAVAAQEQIKRAEKLGKSLDVRMANKLMAADDWTPDEDWRRDFASVTTTIQHAGNSLIRAVEGNKKDLGGQTEAQLEVQFAAELIAAAGQLSDEEWALMVEARAKKQRGE